MHRIVRSTLGAFALLAIPQLATAGPIEWSYTAKVETDRGESFVHFGVETHNWYIPPTFPGESGQEGQTDYQIIANIAANSSGQHSGSVVGSPWVGGIHISSVGLTQLASYSIDNDWASQLPTGFWLRVRITDDASGEFRDVSYSMNGGSSGFFTSGTGVVSLSVEDRTDQFLLGGNQYTVRPRIRRGESATHIEMDVAVDPHTTPEPGTLALAGLGLGGLGLVRRLRKRQGVKGAVVSLALLGGLFGGTATATAGPVKWGYQVHNEDGALLKEQLGITTDNPDNWFVSDWSVPIPEWPVLPHDAPAGYYSLSNESQAKVTIIDQVSGDSGWVWIWWGKSSGWTVGPDGNQRLEWEQQYGGPIWFESYPLLLGGNEYLVTSEGGPFVVRVTAGATAATPEPGSLALAGIGFAGVFARRLRKTRRAR